jgi:hypothetical protein
MKISARMSRFSLQLWWGQLLRWINHKSYHMSVDEGNMRNTRRNEMRIQLLCPTEEHSLCMITATLVLRQMDFARLVEEEDEAGLV